MNQEIYPHEPEFSFKQVLLQRKDDLIYLWKNRLKIIMISMTGILAGAFYAWYKPVTYTSKLSFVVEESKGGGSSLLSGLAGQFGFDLGGMTGTGGVLAGDNVLQLLKSQKMIKSTLLTPYDSISGVSLADIYAESNKLTPAWSKKYNEGRPLSFPVDDTQYTRLQDSLLQVMMKRIASSELSVSKPDKKLSFFEASVTMKNEELAQLFTSRLIDQATEFYIDTKTRRQRNNINRLQVRADSIGLLLNQKTYSASAANEVLLDINPAYPTANVNIQLKERDRMMLQTIYAEIVKNLEISRTMLIQETPTFQVVDEPELPLKKNKTGYLKSIFYGVVIAGGLGCLWVLMRRVES